MADSIYVCQDWFPKDGVKYQREDGFRMNAMLKRQLDILLKNIKDDWDFTIIITGGGEVRVGKSVLAMQIAAYWSYQIEKVYGIKVPLDVKTNFVLDGKKLIEMGNKIGKNHPYSCLIFDEAGADLEGRKTMQLATQDVLDYYRECGQYNMLNVLVLPEYFDLPKGIAVSRSICLIDVYYSVDEELKFRRGYFNFYSRRAKKKLYKEGKRELDYQAAKYDFNGTFPNFFPVNEKEYRSLKQEALSKREGKRRNKFQTQRDACWYLLHKEFGLTQVDLGKRMEQLTGIYVAGGVISDALIHYKVENE